MKFAGCEFNIDEYDGSLYSLQPASARFEPTLKASSYDDINRIITSKPANNSTDKWAKAILLCIVNYKFILKHHRQDTTKKLHWWVYKFNAVLECAITNEELMSGVLDLPTTTIIFNMLIWSNRLYRYYNDANVYVSTHKYQTGDYQELEFESQSPRDIIETIDKNHWVEYDYDNMTSTQLFTFVCNQLALGNKTRIIGMYWEVYHHEQTIKSASAMYGYKSVRAGQLIHKLDTKARELRILRHYKPDEIKKDNIIIHDEHNTLFSYKGD